MRDATKALLKEYFEKPDRRDDEPIRGLAQRFARMVIATVQDLPIAAELRPELTGLRAREEALRRIEAEAVNRLDNSAVSAHGIKGNLPTIDADDVESLASELIRSSFRSMASSLTRASSVPITMSGSSTPVAAATVGS
jgi:hypothetical protein